MFGVGQAGAWNPGNREASGFGKAPFDFGAVTVRRAGRFLLIHRCMFQAEMACNFQVSNGNHRGARINEPAPITSLPITTSASSAAVAWKMPRYQRCLVAPDPLRGDGEHGGVRGPKS